MNSINQFDCAIIGSGISARAAAKYCKKHNINHVILSPITQINVGHQWPSNTKLNTKKLTPKLSLDEFRNGLEGWQNIHQIRTESFSLIQTLGDHGLYKYWGCNLGHSEIYESTNTLSKIIPIRPASKMLGRENNKPSDLNAVGKDLKLNHGSYQLFGHDPLLAINNQQALTQCQECKAYGCNCDGKNLTLIPIQSSIIDGYVFKIEELESGSFQLHLKVPLGSIEKVNCSRIIFAAGPLVSMELASQFLSLPSKIPVIHNGLYSFPFISLIATSNPTFGLSHLNLSIVNCKTKQIESYTNIFPLQPQLIRKYPLMRWLPQWILCRLYYCIVFTHSDYTASYICRNKRLVIGRYKHSYRHHVHLTFRALAKALLQKLKAIPLTLPIISNPGSDIHYGGTLSTSVIPKSLSSKIFFMDTSRRTHQPAVNPTGLHLTQAMQDLENWINKSDEA